MQYLCMIIKSLVRRLGEISRVCIATILSLFFIMVVLVVQSNIYEWQMANNKERFGDWFVIDRGDTKRESFENHPYLEPAKEAYVTVRLLGGNFGRLGIKAGYMQDEFMKDNIHVAKGHMPEKDDEIAMDWNTLIALDLPFELGQTVTLRFHDKDEVNYSNNIIIKKYKVCGILDNYTNTWFHTDWLPRIIMSENEARSINPTPEKVYIFKLKDYVHADDYREIYDKMVGDLVGDYFNFAVYDFKPWGPQSVYNYLYVLVMFIGVVAITYQMSIYQNGRKKTIACLKSIGATRLQINIMRLIENVIIIVISGGIGIALGYFVTRLGFGLVEKDMDVSFFYIDIKLWIRAVASIGITYILQEILHIFSNAFGRVLARSGGVKYKEGKKAITEKNVRRMVRGRLIKANGFALNIGVRLMALTISVIIIICYLNISSAYKEYKENDKRPDFLAFKQGDENVLSYPIMGIAKYYYERNDRGWSGNGTDLTYLAGEKYPIFTLDEAKNLVESRVELFKLPTDVETYKVAELYGSSIVDSAYAKTGNTSLSEGVSAHFIDTIKEVDGVESITYSSFETDRLLTWDGMTDESLDLANLTKSNRQGTNDLFGNRYLFATDYVEPTKELYDRLSKYIDKSQLDYEAFMGGEQVLVITKNHVNLKKDTTITAGKTIDYHYCLFPYVYDIHDFALGGYGANKENQCLGYKYNLLKYGVNYGQKKDAELDRNYELFFSAAASPKIAAVVDYSEEFDKAFEDIIADYAYYTVIASNELAKLLMDRENDMVEHYYNIKLDEEDKMQVMYNQISVKFNLSSTYAATENVLKSLGKAENMIYSVNTVGKQTLRERCLDGILQYGITILAAIVVYLCVSGILLKNRLEQRTERLVTLHRLGMTRGDLICMLGLETLRESIWCILVLPLHMIMALVIIAVKVMRV